MGFVFPAMFLDKLEKCGFGVTAEEEFSLEGGTERKQFKEICFGVA